MNRLLIGICFLVSSLWTLSASAASVLHTYTYTGAAYTDTSYNDGLPGGNILSYTLPGYGPYAPGSHLHLSFTLDQALQANTTLGIEIYTTDTAYIGQYPDFNGYTATGLSGLTLHDGAIDHLSFPALTTPWLSIGQQTTDATGQIAQWELLSGFKGSFDWKYAQTSSAAGDSTGYSYEYSVLQDFGGGLSFTSHTSENALASTDQIGSWSHNVEIIPNPLPPGMALSLGGLGLLLG